MLAYCEACLMTYILLECVEFKQVHFRFGLEASGVQVEFRIIFRSLSLFMIRIVEEFLFSFIFNSIFL